MARIDGARLLADLRALAEIGRWQTGVHRPTYTAADMDARRWLAARLEEAGLDTAIDGVGNVIGRSRRAGPRFLLGSHIETQPYAGWLDGALGVIYGLEVARSLPDIAIDVAAFADEEAHFSPQLGSRSFTETLTDHDLERFANRDSGQPLMAALRDAGLADRPRLRIRDMAPQAYIEAHIEQGDELESKGLRLGVVTGIVGIRQFRIGFDGVQNHAGTTRMAARKDAGVALVRFASAVERAFPSAAGPRSVWTIGRIALEPGSPAVIPGRAELDLQFRDVDAGVLDRMEETLERLVAEAGREGPCSVRMEYTGRTDPALMDPRLQDALERAAERHAPGQHQRMPSGAGHDAQTLARLVPAAMLFVPSIGGISHHHTENTSEEDIVLGCAVLADAVDELATAAGNGLPAGSLPQAGKDAAHAL
jgi:N-carbamoyl-L-amino-acid hydrolase